MEIWKSIQGYEGLYEVSSDGRVKSLFRYKKELKPNITKNGYATVELFKEKTSKRLLIHRLVAMAFLPNPNNLPQVNHIDEDKANNTVENLEWVAHKSNVNHATCQQRKGQTNTARNGRPVLCVETGQIYGSSTIVQKELGFNKGNIWKACNGELKTAYGYHWAFVENQ